MDGQLNVRPGEEFESSILGTRVRDQPETSPSQWFRFGGEALLPGVRGGLFVNLGEFVDFLAGLAGLHPVGDDGVPMGTSLSDWKALVRKREEPAPPPPKEDARESQ